MLPGPRGDRNVCPPTYFAIRPFSNMVDLNKKIQHRHERVYGNPSYGPLHHKDFHLGNQAAFLTAFVSYKRLLTAVKGGKIRQNSLPSALSRPVVESASADRHGFMSLWLIRFPLGLPSKT
jgi:hypothetical protein